MKKIDFRTISATIIVSALLFCCSGCSLRDARHLVEKQSANPGFQLPKPSGTSEPDLSKGANHAGKFGVGIGSGNAKLNPKQKLALRGRGMY